MIRTQEVDADGRMKASGNVAIDDPTQKLHERLRKILALTRSSNEQEAALAAGKLQALLTEHNLSMADLETRGQASPGVREQGHDLGKAGFKWKLDLADGIAEFYYCAPLIDKVNKQVAFVGRPENVEALLMLYGWVIDQIKDIAREERRLHFDKTGEHIDPLRWQIAFGEGAVERLITRLRELKARQLEDMSRDAMGNVTALSIHHASEASDYLEEKYGYRKDGKPTKKDIEWQQYIAKRDAERLEAEEKKVQLRAKCEAEGDMTPYYEAYPNEHPTEVARRKAADDALIKKWRKQDERNARRRTGSYRPGPSIDYHKEEQSSRARESGRAAAGKVNLQPFLTGSKDRKKVGG